MTKKTVKDVAQANGFDDFINGGSYLLCYIHGQTGRKHWESVVWRAKDKAFELPDGTLFHSSNAIAIRREPSLEKLDGLTPKQVTALRCALADLIGSLQAFNRRDEDCHPWDAHEQSILDLHAAFKAECELDDLPEDFE